MCDRHQHPDRNRPSGAVLEHPNDPSLRISSAERDRVIEQLRVHVGAGRLEIDEFGDPVLRDLPTVETGEDRVRRHHDRRAALRPYLGVMVLLVSIWALTGVGYFWPVWPMLGWGIPMFLGLFHGHDGHERTGGATA
jgi:fatty acid desaturase